MFKLANGQEKVSLKAIRTKAQQENIETNNIYYRQFVILLLTTSSGIIYLTVYFQDDLNKCYLNMV